MVASKSRLREIEKEIEGYISSNLEKIEALSPISGYLTGEWDWSDSGDVFFSIEDRYATTRSTYRNNPRKYNENFTKALASLIIIDKEIAAGVEGLFKERANDIGDLTKTLCVCNTERRYIAIKRICQSGLLTDKTQTLLKQSVYAATDAKDECGDKIARYCIDGKINILQELLDEELVEKAKDKSKSIFDHTLSADTAELRSKIVKGDEFIIYRGFYIKGDERVRKGYRKDGNAYYLQDAGTGISYSLDRDVAGYFACRTLIFEEDQTTSRLPSFLYNNVLNGITHLLGKRELSRQRADALSQVRNQYGIKPVIAMYRVKPSAIKGYYMDIAEAEVNVFPENLELIKYEFPKSIDLAECWYNWNNRQMCNFGDIWGGVSDGGIVPLWWGERGKEYVVFAEGSRVSEFCKEFVDSSIKKGKPDIGLLTGLIDEFKDNAVALPTDIDPFRLTPALWEYMTTPSAVKRKRNMVYKMTKDVKRAKKGF